nr:MAG TPA: hypothetical protein [Bacteriophage sp.]
MWELIHTDLRVVEILSSNGLGLYYLDDSRNVLSTAIIILFEYLIYPVTGISNLHSCAPNEAISVEPPSSQPIHTSWVTTDLTH